MPQPHIIAIVNQKGGTGKTTTTVNLGRAIAEHGKKVLLIDLDPQGSLSYYLGANSNVWSISDVILEDISFHNALIQREGLHIIPADVTLADLELSLVSYQGREQILKKNDSPKCTRLRLYFHRLFAFFIYSYRKCFGCRS
jgi:chromosome partitioning protein